MLLDDTIEYTKGVCRYFQERWKELGGNIVGSDTFKNDDLSIRSQVSRINQDESQVDFMVLCSYPPGAPKAIRQLRTAGVDLPIVSSESMDGSYARGACPT